MFDMELWPSWFRILKTISVIAQFSNSNVATKCCQYPLKLFTFLHQTGGAGLWGSGNGNCNI